MPALPVSRIYCLSHSIFASRPGRLSVISSMLRLSLFDMFQTFKTGGFDAFFYREKVVESRASGSGLDVEITDTHLFDPCEIVITDVFVDLHRNLDTRREGNERFRPGTEGASAAAMAAEEKTRRVRSMKGSW